MSAAAAATLMSSDLQRQDQDQEEEEEEATRTLLDLLNTDKMNGSDHSSTIPTTPTTASAITSESTSHQGQLGRWGALKQRLGLNAIICCGGGWAHHNRSFSFSDALLPVDDADVDDDDDHTQNNGQIHLPPVLDDPDDEEPVSPGMNLATALAEERQSRQLTVATRPPVEVEAISNIISTPGTPLSAKVSLMRLMAEAVDEEEGGEVVSGSGGMCCVCMERKKGAAFIPCGHTFCRVCSRELWLNGGSCPLCNRSILDVLDIF